MSEEIPITIVGGGVVGCAIAYELSRHTDRQIVLLDRNPHIPGENQSSRNSGVVHAGIYYRKDTEPLKAKLCVEGNQKLYEFCEEFDVPYSKTGKLVVATNAREEEYLDGALAIARENGVSQVRKINGVETKSMEPNVEATSALYVPTSGIVEPTALVRKLRGLAEANGAYIFPQHNVLGITPKQRGFTVTTESRGKQETYETQVLINTAGLYSDEIARMVNPDSHYEIVPIRLEASKFSKARREDLGMRGMNVYPTPRGFDSRKKQVLDIPYKEFEQLCREGKASTYPGVHLTPTLDLIDETWVVGDLVTIGPAFTPVNGKEDWGKNRLSETFYREAIRPYFPNMREDDISPQQVGIMAKLKEGNDFVIERDSRFPDCINLIGIDSPGLTSSLSIADFVRRLMEE